MAVGGFPDAGWQGKSRCGKSGLFSQRVQLSGTGRPDSLRLRFLSLLLPWLHIPPAARRPAVSRNSTPTAARFSQRTAAVCQAAAAMQRAGQPSTGGKGRPSPEKSDFRPGRTAYVPAVDSRQWTELFSALWNPPTTSGSSAIVPAAAFIPPIRLERRKTRVDRFGRSLLPNENAQFRRAGFHRLWGKFFVPAALLFCPGGAAGLFFIA